MDTNNTTDIAALIAAHLTDASASRVHLDNVINLVTEMGEPMTFASIKNRATENRDYFTAGTSDFDRAEAVKLADVIQACDKALVANVAAAELAGEIDFGGR